MVRQLNIVLRKSNKHSLHLTFFSRHRLFNSLNFSLVIWDGFVNRIDLFSILF